VGTLGFAAFSLVGCGDDDDGGEGGSLQLATPTPAAGATPIDPFAGAKKGGTLRLDNSIDPPTIDPYGNVSVRTKTMANYVYSRLMKYKTGPEFKQGNVRPTGDLAEKVEASADGLTYTYRIRQGIKFHNLAPVNGRALVSMTALRGRRRPTSERHAASSARSTGRIRRPHGRDETVSRRTPRSWT
jgi:peptide/nickel transport system substrate-binding protein